MTDINAIHLDKLRECLPELEALYQAHDDAKLSYAAGIDAVAEATGVSKPALRKLVAALKRDKADDAKAEAQELADLLGAVSA